jgi:hypothetical protein
MRKTLFCLALAGAVWAQDTPKDGWQLLFDGRSLAGWQALPTSAPGSNGDWKVENGSIVCPGTSAGWLASDAEFTDFHLTLQFRGAEKVNSGVFLRSQKTGQPHITGYELQIWDYQPAGYNTGSLVNFVKAPPVKILADRWNDYDITAEGDRFVVVLNGKPLLDAHDPAHAAGRIGFQCQPNNRIEFRNIRIRRLGH